MHTFQLASGREFTVTSERGSIILKESKTTAGFSPVYIVLTPDQSKLLQFALKEAIIKAEK